jgi:hypothetical protein
VICPEILDNVPTFLDPITYNNAGKSSYRIGEVKKLFNACYEELNEMKMQMDKKKIKVEENLIHALISKNQVN